MKRPWMIISLICFIQLVLFPISADVYMHNPRGSNDRGCETNQNRNNGNLLFDSQNNDNGGYSCPRAWPFACYRIENATLRQECNDLNADKDYDDISTLNMVDNQGVLHPSGTRTPQMYYYEGSVLQLEWTNQHGCGDNPRTHCDIILQYACEDTLTDDCGEPDSGKKCGPRDGIPISNSQKQRGSVTFTNILNGEQNNINRQERDTQCTERIPVSLEYNVQSDPRFPRHEGLKYYTKCYQRERNKGLWTADRNVNNNIGATATRQNNNGNRNGLECPEERDYYPYWAPSPWKDIAILTDRVSECEWMVSESQNIKEKYECVCPACLSDTPVRPVPNNRGGCTMNGGTWVFVPPHGINAPVCGPPPTARENNLGNPIGGGKSASSFNWTLPYNVASGSQCIVRLRYNISTGDPISARSPEQVSVTGTSALNMGNSPLLDRQNSESKAYKSFVEMPSETHPAAKLGLAINTNQFGRTFQDRSFVFEIRKRPVQQIGLEYQVYNLNVRGKRGDIRDVYPSVEYDFVPNELYVLEQDLIHIQWTGSDYNVNRGDGEESIGGPPDPNNLAVGRTDRHNLVQTNNPGFYASIMANGFTMFSGLSQEEQFALQFIRQNLSECLSIDELIALGNDPNFAFQSLVNSVERRDKYYQNCGKLSNAETPYFDAGLVHPGGMGSYSYMCTRNTVFGVHLQVGLLHVQSSVLANGSLLVTVVGAALGFALAGAFFLRVKQKKQVLGEDVTNFTLLKTSMKPDVSPIPDVPKRTKTDLIPLAALASNPQHVSTTTQVTALHAHEAKEEGELPFKRGDKITVLRKDDSGWWEGRTADGKMGIFPSNYVS